MTHAGGCHCGSLRYALDSALALAQLPLRACQCSFCRHHGAISTSDPAGSLTFTMHDPARVIRYRFGLKTADFLICAVCGVYVGAEIAEGRQHRAIINANTLDTPPRGHATPMDYSGEDVATRQARRRARWTPVP